MITPDRIVSTTCPYCGVGCNLHLHVKDEFIYRVTSPHHAVVNQGNLCVTGRFGYDFMYHPDRVTTPLIRKTPQQPGTRTQALDRSEWREASWEEALDYAADRLVEIYRRAGTQAKGPLGHHDLGAGLDRAAGGRGRTDRGERVARPAVRQAGEGGDQVQQGRQPPAPLQPYVRDWQRPQLDWASIVSGIEQHGLRNAAQTTVAPTGTIATVVGCEGYGCEPVFALGYIRHFKDGDRDVELYYTSPLFEQALNATALGENEKADIKQHVASYGTCQDLSLIHI